MVRAVEIGSKAGAGPIAAGIAMTTGGRAILETSSEPRGPFVGLLGNLTDYQDIYGIGPVITLAPNKNDAGTGGLSMTIRHTPNGHSYGE